MYNLKASEPVSPDIIKSLGFSENDVITTAAVCVYPARVADAVAALKCLRPDGKVKVAAGIKLYIYQQKSLDIMK